ncbi:unnamed protein product [Heligmosomoides polygyrus]|uniref:Transposase n=1 Tax=Heligmosomoides polygyrus TaxID=6339 RepID=A0A183F428_HELPZ|nr:unnamed protein product [Heligmosomoides polygyrus]
MGYKQWHKMILRTYSAIFTDWNHTREWKASGKKSFLQTEILSQQNRED